MPKYRSRSIVPSAAASKAPRRGILCALLLGIALVLHARGVEAQQSEPDPEKLGRPTAVALNYCRASFHRIERCPSKRVLIEEREKILNNLNLNQIADEEVVRLYTAVLDEINRIQVADLERQVIRDLHRRAVTEHLAITAFQLSTQLATAEYAPAIRTGVKSWWDYRGMVFDRELEKWQIEKKRMTEIVDKSSLFLDTFWKLARRRSIRDNWLVRSSDLDRLEEALREPDLQVRLRVLKRMQNFMECYPPYWYYVARTQQALGQLFAAAETYQRLAELGDGHFRKDEMLAAGQANLAVIREYLQQRGAADVAQSALRYSTDAWEVNLMCARVLERHGQVDLAEDAILRNLDVDLEREQSFVCLLSLYYHSTQTEKLAARLSERNALQTVPADVLLQCAALLGTEQTPAAAVDTLKNSLYGSVDARFGRDDFVFYSTRNWPMNAVRMSLQYGDEIAGRPAMSQAKASYVIRFREVAEVGNPLSTGTQLAPVVLSLQFPDGPAMQIAMEYTAVSAQELQAAGSDPSALLTSVLPLRRNVYRITAAAVGNQVVLLERGRDVALPFATIADTVNDELSTPSPLTDADLDPGSADVVAPLPPPEFSDSSAPPRAAPQLGTGPSLETPSVAPDEPRSSLDSEQSEFGDGEFPQDEWNDSGDE